jgi:hypothetical protein
MKSAVTRVDMKLAGLNLPKNKYLLKNQKNLENVFTVFFQPPFGLMDCDLRLSKFKKE